MICSWPGQMILLKAFVFILLHINHTNQEKGTLSCQVRRNTNFIFPFLLSLSSFSSNTHTLRLFSPLLLQWRTSTKAEPETSWNPTVKQLNLYYNEKQACNLCWVITNFTSYQKSNQPDYKDILGPQMITLTSSNRVQVRPEKRCLEVFTWKNQVLFQCQ